MNQQINWSNQLRSLQEKQRNEYNQVMANMQGQYQQQMQALQQQFNPYSQMQQAQAISQQPIVQQQASAVQPSPEEQSVSQTDSLNRVPLQQLAILAEIKTLMAEMRDALKASKATTEISTEVETPQVEATPVSETKAKSNKPIKSE